MILYRERHLEKYVKLRMTIFKNKVEQEAVDIGDSQGRQVIGRICKLDLKKEHAQYYFTCWIQFLDTKQDPLVPQEGNLKMISIMPWKRFMSTWNLVATVSLNETAN